LGNESRAAAGVAGFRPLAVGFPKPWAEAAEAASDSVFSFFSSVTLGGGVPVAAEGTPDSSFRRLTGFSNTNSTSSSGRFEVVGWLGLGKGPEMDGIDVSEGIPIRTC